MSQGKRRRKAAAQQKQQRRVQQGLPPSEPPPDAFVPRRDEAAEELLTSRGWISLRGLGMDEEGDGWEWTPSQLPLSLVDGGEPVPTSVYTEGTHGFTADPATVDGMIRPGRRRSYPDLGALAADLDDLEAWRVPAGECRLPDPLVLSADRPWEIGELHAGGVIDEQELVADLLHYPYEEDPGDPHSPRSFRQVRRAQRLELVPTFLYKALVAARTS